MIFILFFIVSAAHTQSKHGTLTGCELNNKSTLQLYQMMKDVDELLRLQDVDYWAIGGTLLGAIRHGGIIPWDSEPDIDIGINRCQVDRFLALRESLNKLNYELLSYYYPERPDVLYGFKIYLKDGIGEPSWKFKFPFIDINIFTYNEEKTLLKYCDRGHDGCVFFTSELYPLIKVKFGGGFISCPFVSNRYLDIWYGNWRTEACAYDAITKEFFAFIMQASDYLPALPFGPLEDRVASL